MMSMLAASPKPDITLSWSDRPEDWMAWAKPAGIHPPMATYTESAVGACSSAVENFWAAVPLTKSLLASSSVATILQPEQVAISVVKPSACHGPHTGSVKTVCRTCALPPLLPISQSAASLPDSSQYCLVV